MSPAFSFNKDNARHVFHVFLWSFGSSVAALAIALLASVQVPVEYVFLVPIANSALVWAQQYFTEQAQQ